MAIFEEHKYEKKYLERLHNPKTAHKAITPHMAKQKRTSEPQPDGTKRKAALEKAKGEKKYSAGTPRVSRTARELERFEQTKHKSHLIP